MAYRFTNTDKWGDSWYSELKPAEKLLFIYLCDNCDIAGFIEINIKRWGLDIGYDRNIIEGALKGLQRGLIIAETNDCIFIRNYIKHQKNLPLSPETNPAHRGIYKRFELYANKFNINNIEEFMKGASKGLQSPIGIGNGNGSGIGEGKKETENYKKMYHLVVKDNGLIIPDGFEEMILEWLKYKSEKGQSYKQTGMKTMINVFIKNTGGDKIIGREMLDFSMSKNYNGLYKEQKNERNSTGNRRDNKRTNSYWD